MKVEMELLREEAIEAKQNKLEENHLHAQKLKVEGEIRMDQLEQEKAEDMVVKKELIEAIQEQ